MAGHRTDLRIVLWAVLVSVLAIPLGASAPSLSARAASSPIDGSPLPSPSRVTCHVPSLCPSGTETVRTGSAPVPEPFDAGQMLAWSEILSEAPSGTLGAGAGMVADSSPDSAIVFGGAGIQGLSNATLSYSESTNAWTTVRTRNAPGPRSDFAFGFDPTTGDAVLFGGLVNLTSESVSSATWAYSVGAGTWTNVSQAGPPPREDPALAIDPALGIGLLYGGENPNYESVGTIVYSDLWELNLSTFAWTEIKVTSGPRPAPLEGAALAWDPSNGEFQMFGGCTPCSNTVWEFDPLSDKWSELAPPPNAPTPVSGASWTYDLSLGADLLFGGTDGTAAENETAIFYPGNDTWVPQTLPGPDPRWSAASAYLNVTGNATWLVAGGATLAGPAFDLWRLSATSDLEIRVENASAPNVPVAGADLSLNGQTLGSTTAEGYLNLTQINGVDSPLRVDAFGYFANTSTLWLPPGSSTQRIVLLTVIPPRDLGTILVTVDAAEGGPIVGADVSLTLNGTPVNSVPAITGPTGVVNFTRLPPGTFNVSVSAAGWRVNSTEGNVTPGAKTFVTVQLSADPVLSVIISGKLPSGSIVPLEGVTVSLNGISFGVTDAKGNLTQPTAAFGPYNVTGDVPGYLPGSIKVLVPWTGDVNTSLVLVSLPAGGINVLVVDGSNGQPLDRAEVDVDSSGPLPSGWTNVTLYTNVTGRANDSTLLEGYYEVTADAAGYYASTPDLVHVFPSENLTRSIALVRTPGANIAFLVRSATRLVPIFGANVSVSGYTSGQTDLFGFFNVSEIPPGTYVVTASATGYVSNTSIFQFYVLENATIPINLTPFVLAAPHPSASPAGSGSLWTLLLVPVVLAVGGVLYTATTRSDRPEEDGRNVLAERRSGPRAPPPGSPS